MIHLCRFCLATQPFSPHPGPTPPPTKTNSCLTTHPPRAHPSSGTPERNAGLQDPPLSVCHQHFNAPSECLELCLEPDGEGGWSPLGLAQETAAEVRQAESADPARGDHFYSDASPSSTVRLLGPVFRERERRDRERGRERARFRA